MTAIRGFFFFFIQESSLYPEKLTKTKNTFKLEFKIVTAYIFYRF